MKKTILLPLISAISLLFVFVACKKESPIATPASSQSNSLMLQSTANRSSLPFELEALSADEGVNYNSLSLDSVAAIHNQAMEYVVDKIVEDEICAEDNEEFRSRLASYLEGFLTTKGLSAEIKINSIEGAKGYDDMDLCSTGFESSSEATELTCEVQNSFDDFSTDKISASEFSERINSVISNANNLGDLDEKRVVQVTATICRSSVFFWKDNLSRLREKLMSHCGTGFSGLAQRNNIPWGGVAYADASGAITWGRVGFFAAGGPAGAAA